MHIIGEGGEKDPRALKLQTRRRNHIPNVVPDEWEEDRLRTYYDKCRSEHSEARILSVTGLYNCMGLAFAARRTEIDINQLHFILMDDGYKNVPDETDCDVGDIVVYAATVGGRGYLTHVGIVACMEPRLDLGLNKIVALWSKWGSGPECIHRIEDVPAELGSPVEFWTDRRSRP